MTEPRHDHTPDTAGWHRPDVETAALEHLTTAVGPVSARQLVDGLLNRGRDTAAKDTPRGASTLPSSVRDLLAAIRDAVNLPLPSTADADDHAWQQLMHRRLIDLHAVLSVSLHPDYAAGLDPADLAADIRARTAAAPVAYTLWQPTALGGGERP